MTGTCLSREVCAMLEGIMTGLAMPQCKICRENKFRPHNSKDSCNSCKSSMKMMTVYIKLSIIIWFNSHILLRVLLVVSPFRVLNTPSCKIKLFLRVSSVTDKPGPEFEPGSHWWETSVSTAAPRLWD